MILFFLEIIYPKVPGALAPQDFITTALPEDILSLYAKYLINLCIWTAGIIAFAGLIYGGVLYLISTGKPDRMASAKSQISAAFFGLLLILSSFIILKTLNPQFINLKIPAIEKVEVVERPDIPLPEITAINSSLDVEMPFARVIEKLFETYISDYPEPEQKKEPRMLRIKNIARAIIGQDQDEGLADKLKNQSQDLKEAAEKCSCQQTKPEEPCGDIETGNTTWKCDCDGCSATEPVTSDPCAEVRGDIQKLEEENLNVIYRGTEIVQFDKNDKKNKITTNLKEEQIKTGKEVRLLKDWLERLKRAEKFIKECPLRSINSLAQFYSKKDTFDNNKWDIRDTKFWDDVNIIYYMPSKKSINDFATFYCAVSGTLEQEYPFSSFEPGEDELTGEESIEEAEEVLSEAMACSDEAPVGEIIDRAKRTAQLLIDKLEILIEKDKQLIDAVDELQVLISQCSSQRGCERRCSCFSCGCGSDPCIDMCQGWAYGCADSSGPYPSECKKRDENTPCPYEEIKEKLEEIEKIWQEIKDLVEGKKLIGQETPKEKVEKTGIMPLINEVIPEILKDLESSVRIPMKKCSSEDWLEQDTVLFNCLQAKGAVIPPEEETGEQKRMLRECCPTQIWENGKSRQTIYGDCFEECYLEIGQDNHRECVRECLEGLNVMLNDPKISECIHELNFYCCHAK